MFPVSMVSAVQASFSVYCMLTDRVTLHCITVLGSSNLKYSRTATHRHKRQASMPTVVVTNLCELRLNQQN